MGPGGWSLGLVGGRVGSAGSQGLGGGSGLPSQKVKREPVEPYIDHVRPRGRRYVPEGQSTSIVDSGGSGGLGEGPGMDLVVLKDQKLFREVLVGSRRFGCDLVGPGVAVNRLVASRGCQWMPPPKPNPESTPALHPNY